MVAGPGVLARSCQCSSSSHLWWDFYGRFRLAIVFCSQTVIQRLHLLKFVSILRIKEENSERVLIFCTGRDIPHSPVTFGPHARTHSFGSMNEDTDAFPQGSLKCLRYLDKSEFGASQLAKHTFVFTCLLVISLMVWFLGELFLDIGVSYSLSTIISTLPGAFFVGAPLASFLHLFLVTGIFDVLPKPCRRRSVYYWGTQLFVYGLLATSVSVASKQSRGLCKAFWPADKCDYATDTDRLVIFMAPNLYIILLMTCITVLVVLVTTGAHLCTSQSWGTRQESDEESSPLEGSPEM